ncbi:MAG: ATP-binding cassette domain-containing protein [Cycloclasticus sp.]|nr:ATP-binding cassette domain-containing protein [Cycloclasticus sp.]
MFEHEAVISLQNIGISYPIKTGFLTWSKHVPFNNVSFDLYRGETIGVIGGNGVGKSTLLRIIAGVIEPDKGSVINYGARVSLLSLGVGFVAHLTGRENAILSGMLLGFRKSEIVQKLDCIKEFSELGVFFDQRLSTYSSGMKARLGFSVAIQVETDVLLIDEVLAVGDKEFKHKSRVEMKRLIQSEKTVVLVSHSLPVIENQCDRVLWLDDEHGSLAGETKKILKLYQEKQK